MVNSFRRYLIDAYSLNENLYFTKTRQLPFIQIDDQDDRDNITEFVNIFITPKRKYNFELELLGPMPITQEMVDLAEIYRGKANLKIGKITLELNPKIIDVVLDLAAIIRKSSSLGESIGNDQWERISGRTISSLYRFVRIVKDFISLKESQLI